MKIKVYGYWLPISAELFLMDWPEWRGVIGEHATHVLRYRAISGGFDTVECQECNVRIWGEPLTEYHL
jgi:hypothetical protein